MSSSTLACEASSPSQVDVIPVGYDIAQPRQQSIQDGLIDLNLDHELAQQAVLGFAVELEYN
ncbi:MAG TPA: hypothetical protein ENN07_07775 [candidate division Zixibacteria bacterium]|nr:hypothetical protein [candidate division Zixibacteria bacterium]